MPTIAKDNTVIKVACLECIRGHRSSQCAHVNKVLIEVRRPGRPLNNSSNTPGGHTEALPSHLQPAYVVSGHSRCECPPSGVIPESDWEQTAAQPYPKGKGAEQAFRVGKTGPKIRAPRASISRRSTLSQLDNAVQQSSVTSSSTPTTSGTGVTTPTESPAKPSCCQNKEAKSSHQPQKVVMPKQMQLQSPASGARPLHPNVDKPEIFAYAPLKVNYDTTYNTMTDDQFQTFLDSISAEQLMERFPWKREVQPQSHARPTNGSLRLRQQQTLQGKTDSISNHASPKSNATGSQNFDATQDGCCCGDDCSCLGCAVHPANATTMDHVREATEFMQNDPHYADDRALAYEHISAVLQAREDSKRASLTPQAFGQAHFAQSLNFSSDATFDQRHDPMFPPFNPTQDQEYHQFIQPPLKHIDGLQRTFDEQVLPSLNSNAPLQPGYHDFGSFDPHDALLYSGFGQHQQAFTLHPFSGNDQVFVMAQDPRPTCVDDQGFCQCGPGCTCEGCQVHKGPQHQPKNVQGSTTPVTDETISGQRENNDLQYHSPEHSGLEGRQNGSRMMTLGQISTFSAPAHDLSVPAISNSHSSIPHTHFDSSYAYQNVSLQPVTWTSAAHSPH
ncbi:hypothetical protein FH972_022089 [Carpinus fangiana]|uniref:Copper-fist domain-containing protein n=1 Tax=Carpinus fangiana TaxID=176857 RepID=A0A5N6KRR6_9ROSI|nr:hypothetical protein FH972_022089 [Carpinus fangiana]